MLEGETLTGTERPNQRPVGLGQVGQCACLLQGLGQFMEWQR
jgi:hypothetical protein